MMIKVFSNELNAQKFAKQVNGKLTIRYDWDAFRKKLIKEFVVRF